ncbi:MAG: Fe-S cluster assembly protein SufD [Hydrogenibacillus sp.]|nr:Fe-S cluster assembly protein SufD [Hydrogenibacillus sp.]
MTAMSMDVQERAYQALAERLLAHLPEGEPPWMAEARRRAASGLQHLPYPLVEKMNIAAWPWHRLELPTQSEDVRAAADLPADVRHLLDDASPTIVVHRGTGVYRAHTESVEAEGVIVTDLATALSEHAELLRERLFRLVGPEDDRLAALSAAAFRDGVFVYVPRGLRLERPVNLVFVAGEGGLATRTVVVAEPESRLELIETRLSLVRAASDAAPIIHNGVSELFVEDGAHVLFASVNRFGPEVVDHSRRVARVGRDGAIVWAIGEVGHANGMMATQSELRGEGARAEVNMIGVGTGAQRNYFDLRVRHYGRHSESMMLAKGILLDQAQQIYNGVTKIEKKATKASGEQTERLLVLSPEARGDANPILLIEENDVKAGHAASVGRIDELQLYYLMSRGLTREAAEKLLLFAFLDPVIARIPLPGVKARLVEAIEVKLTR